MEIKPSLLISPHGLNIADCLFRCPEEELGKYRYASHFAKDFELYQPRLSQLLSSIEAKNLVVLRRFLQRKSLSWWKSSMQAPQNRRYLPLFETLAKPYYSRLDVSESAVEYQDGQIMAGPISLARSLGFLVDSNNYVWGTSQGLQKLKRRHQLIPGEGGRKNTWYLAEVSATAKKMAVQRSGPPTNFNFEGNTLRAIYDLFNLSEARVEEVLPDLLKKVLYEI